MQWYIWNFIVIIINDKLEELSLTINDKLEAIIGYIFVIIVGKNYWNRKTA